MPWLRKKEAGVNGQARAVVGIWLVLVTALSGFAVATPVAATESAAVLTAAVSTVSPGNGGSLALSDVGQFSDGGGVAVIEPGSVTEEPFAYTGVDADTASLVGITRPVPQEHPAGASVTTSVLTPCELLEEGPNTVLSEVCWRVDEEVDEAEAEVMETVSCVTGTDEPARCIPIDLCEPEGCVPDPCPATNGCDLSEPVPGVDVDPTDAVLALVPDDHESCEADSGAVGRDGRFVWGDGSFECTAPQHFIVTVKVVVKVKVAGAWGEFAAAGAAAESSCCIGVLARAACSPGTNFKYRVVTAGKAANSEGKVVHEDKDRGWDTVDRIACPEDVPFLL